MDLEKQIKEVKDEQSTQQEQIQKLQDDVQALKTPGDVAASPGLARDENSVPHYVTITGFCTYSEINEKGWTSEEFRPLLKTPFGSLPDRLCNSVSIEFDVMGYKKMKFIAWIGGGAAREVQQRWQEWLTNT